jgi:5-methylcytosine-specific restriction endonuclease McrA
MLALLSDELLTLLRFQGKLKKTKVRRKRRRFKQRVFWRDGGLCQYCGDKVKFEQATLDHIHPVALGGSDRHKENFAISCFKCNQQKAQLVLEELGDLAPDELAKKFKLVCG